MTVQIIDNTGRVLYTGEAPESFYENFQYCEEYEIEVALSDIAHEKADFDCWYDRLDIPQGIIDNYKDCPDDDCLQVIFNPKVEEIK